VVAGLQAAYAVARNPKAHFSYRLEAARIITALENGLALQLKFTGNDLRRAIREEIARGDVSEQLTKITGVVRKIEQDQRKIVAPMVRQVNEQIVESTSKPIVTPQPATEARAQATKATTDDLSEVLNQLKSRSSVTTVVETTAPEVNKGSTSIAPVEARLSEEDLASVQDFAEFLISAQELETALSPYLQIEWAGEFKDQIKTVALTGIKLSMQDRIVVTPALLERAQRLAVSPSQRDRQLVREWTQIIPKAPLFTASVEVLKEIMWLKQQTNL